MAEKKAYIVTAPGCYAGAVGARVELSDREATNLINKVRSVDAVKADENAPNDNEIKLAKQVDSLTAELETARTQLAELEGIQSGENEKQLTKDLAAANDKIAELTAGEDATAIVALLDEAADKDPAMAAYLTGARATVSGG